MLATQVLPDDTLDDSTTQDEAEIVGHLVTDNKEYEIRRGENKIGRDPSCSIVINNCTISKHHAVIESDGRDETFIYDCGSTNLTRLGKKKLRPLCRYKLDDKTDIILGNIVATFKIAPNSPKLNISKTISVNTQALAELDEIFDLPTQVPIPGPSTSWNVPTFIDSNRIKNSPVCNKTQTVLIDQKSDLKLENSDIFNLSTQCQLETQDDCDKMKSLLNDGQDDVLCNVMSMLPPKSDAESFDIYDAPTQVEDVCKNEDIVVKVRKDVKEVTLDQHGGDSKVTQNFDKVTKKEFEMCIVRNEAKDAEEALKNGDESFTQEFGVPNNKVDESVLEISFIDPEEDSILTQKFNDVTKKEAEIFAVGKEVKDAEETQIPEDEDAILTQELVLPNYQRDEPVLETSVPDQAEDSIATQTFDEEAILKLEKTVMEKTDCDDKSNTAQSGEGFQDFISTQIFEIENFTERIETHESNSTKDNEPEPAENSGDETVSDLEIDNENNLTLPEVQRETEIEEDRNSNDSYTFEVDSKEADADSDATDCEVVLPVKTEPPEPPPASEDTQVLTLTPPSNLNPVNISTDRRSPSPRCWSPLSLEMPSTQDVESTMEKFLEKENQVGNASHQTDSPLKRGSGVVGSNEPSPSKKPKTDTSLSKICQIHDIGQVQPTRTRNSLRTIDTNKQSCRRSTRGRKSNPEITPYLIRYRKKTETPKENTRVLRSRQSERFTSPRGKRRSKTGVPVIAFTGFENESLKKIISDLGGEKTDDLLSASVLVANKVRRTVKFLCGIGLSLPIVSPQWLLASKKEMKFLNPRDFILKDEEAEEKWAFSLKNSLQISKSTKLLEGYSVFATKSTKPPVKDLLAIVECSGGTPIVNRPTTWPRKTIFVSCEEDKEAWPPTKARNVKLVHYEFILTGILRQKIDFNSYSLR